MCDLSGWQQVWMAISFLVFVWIWSSFIYYKGRKDEKEERKRFERTLQNWQSMNQ